MPISTPDSVLDRYRHDSDHFRHVFHHLIAPAVERAGLVAIPPSARGADLIHAEIIRNLVEAKLVLCDMSLLNANVFFELGVRTALNKPVCVIKDSATPNVPFDASIVNFHTYSPTLDLWSIDSEIDRLSSHVSDSLLRSSGQNPIWKHFGIALEAKIERESPGGDALLKNIAIQIDQIQRSIKSEDFGVTDDDAMQSDLFYAAMGVGLVPKATARCKNYLEIYFEKALDPVERERLKKATLRIDAEIIVVDGGEKSLL